MLSGWKETTFNGQPAWSAPAPEAYFRQLWVNGERRERPRLPKEGFYRFAGLAPGVEAPEYSSGQTEFLVNPGEAQVWKNLTDVEMIIFTL